MNAPAPINAVVDHDARTVTVAFTFRWSDVWAMDKCEIIPFVAGVREAIKAHLLAQDEPKATGFSYTCWEPNEEVDAGWLADFRRATCTLCGKPAETTSAPPWFRHLDVPTDCRNFLDDIGDENGFAINFANLLDVDLTPEPVQPDPLMVKLFSRPQRIEGGLA